jgi:hypothetical protein
LVEAAHDRAPACTAEAGMTKPGASTPTSPPAIVAIVSDLAAAKRTCGLARRGGDRQGPGLAEARGRGLAAARGREGPLGRGRGRSGAEKGDPGALAQAGQDALPGMPRDPGAAGAGLLQQGVLAGGVGAGLTFRLTCP